MSTGDCKKKKRLCPDCRKSLNSKMMLMCYDDLKASKNGGGGGLRDHSHRRDSASGCNDPSGYREGLGLGFDCEKGFYEGGEYDEEEEDDEEDVDDNDVDEEIDKDYDGNGVDGNGRNGSGFGGGSGVRGGLSGSFGGSGGRLPILSGSTPRINSLGGSGYGGLSGSRALSGSVGVYNDSDSTKGLVRGLSSSDGLMGIGGGSSSHIQLSSRGGILRASVDTGLLRDGSGLGSVTGGVLTRGLSSSGGLGEGELSSLDVIGGRALAAINQRRPSTSGASYDGRYHRGNPSPQRLHDQRL